MKGDNMDKKYYPNDNWEIDNSLFSNGDNLKSNILDNYYNINGILIIKNGYIAYEEYFNDKNIYDRFNVASVTKSILSSLIGIAIDSGFINSIQDKVIDYYSEYNLTKNKTRDKVTIHDLLSMTAPYAFRNMGQKLGKLINSDNWIEHSLSILGLGGENYDFKYSDASAHLLSGIITKTTDLTAREFANKYLCPKIKMSEIPDVNMDSFELRDILFTDKKGWLKDKQDLTIGGWGLTLTLRDMARFGLLYERNGIWNDEIIISKDYIENSIKNYSTNYGYLWWLKNINNHKIYYAMGTGGNMIVCIPELNTTIAIASDVTRENIADRWILIEEYILNTVDS